VRDLADEGYYVGRRPLISSKDKNKMENRLLKEPDGRVRKQPSGGVDISLYRAAMLVISISIRDSEISQRPERLAQD